MPYIKRLGGEIAVALGKNQNDQVVAAAKTPKRYELERRGLYKPYDDHFSPSEMPFLVNGPGNG
jgi:hypothetical protein